MDRESQAGSLVQLRFDQTQLVYTSELPRNLLYVIHSVATRPGELRQEERWKRMGKLGQGTYGEVFLEVLEGHHPPQHRAVKEITKNESIDYRNEVINMTRLSQYHQFVKLRHWYEDPESPEKVFLAMEYLPLGNLERFANYPFPEGQVQMIARQLLSGLQIMHRHNIIHRDLTLRNILVVKAAPDWHVKIGDFGFAKQRSTPRYTSINIGTPAYTAPEITLAGAPYDLKVDIWSLGCVLFKLLTNVFPFTGESLRLYYSGAIKFPKDTLRSVQTSAEGLAFLETLLQPDPSMRITAESALSTDTWIGGSRYTDTEASHPNHTVTHDANLSTLHSLTFPVVTLKQRQNEGRAATIDGIELLQTPMPLCTHCFSQPTRTLTHRDLSNALYLCRGCTPWEASSSRMNNESDSSQAIAPFGPIFGRPFHEGCALRSSDVVDQHEADHWLHKWEPTLYYPFRGLFETPNAPQEFVESCRVTFGEEFNIDHAFRIGPDHVGLIGLVFRPPSGFYQWDLYYRFQPTERNALMASIRRRDWLWIILRLGCLGRLKIQYKTVPETDTVLYSDLSNWPERSANLVITGDITTKEPFEGSIGEGIHVQPGETMHMVVQVEYDRKIFSAIEPLVWWLTAVDFVPISESRQIATPAQLSALNLRRQMKTEFEAVKDLSQEVLDEVRLASAARRAQSSVANRNPRSSAMV